MPVTNVEKHLNNKFSYVSMQLIIVFTVFITCLVIIHREKHFIQFLLSQ